MMGIEVTAAAVADWHEAGSGFWWSADGEFVTTADRTPPDATEVVYLMSWDAAWFAQWADDWEAAAAQLNELIEATDA